MRDADVADAVLNRPLRQERRRPRGVKASRLRAVKPTRLPAEKADAAAEGH